VALLCVALALWLAFAPRHVRRPVDSVPAMPALTAEVRHGEPAARVAPAPSREVAALDASPLPDAASAGLPLSPPELEPTASLALFAKAADGPPLEGVELRLEPAFGPHEAGLAPALARHAPRAARTGPEGWSLVSNLYPGPWRVLARHPSGLARATTTTLAPGANQLELELGASEALVVHVTAQGAPVAGARVEVTGHWLDEERRPLLVGLDGAPPAALTGADGVARFPAQSLARGFVVARAPDGRVGFWSGTAARIEVRLEPAATLSGRLTGLAPAELAETRVLLRLASGHHPHYTTYARALTTPVAADGSFRFENLPAGQHGLGLDDPRGARLDLPAQADGGLENSVEPLTVELAAGATTTIELAVVRGARLAGTVTDETGAPLAGVRVRATLAPRTSNFPDGFDLHGVNVWRFDADGTLAGDHPETHRTATSDAGGRWTLPGLHPGTWRLELALTGRSYVRESITLSASETRALTHTLARAGALEGVDRRGGGYLGVRALEAAAPFAIAVLPHSGGFAFTGLVPGRYELARYHSNDGVAPVPLATVEVRAGETTWVDLARAPRPILIRGRVTSAGLPVTGARVVLWPLEVTTDAAGRFQFDQEFPPGEPSFQVVADDVTSRFEVAPEGSPANGYEVELALASEELTLRIEEHDGRPARARVRLTPTEQAPVGNLLHVAVQDHLVEGTTRLTHLAPGTYTVDAVLDGLRLQRSLTLPGPAELVLRAPPSATLEVEVLGPAGGRLARGQLVVDVLDAPELGLAARAASRRVSGAPLRFERLPAGRLAVSLLSDEHGWQVRTWAREEVTVLPGESRFLKLQAAAVAEGK